MSDYFSLLDQASPWLVFSGIFLASYIENIFPPIPGDTMLVFGAYLVGRGNLSYSGALATTLAGSVLGFMTIYWVGRYARNSLIVDKIQRSFTPRRRRALEQLFRRWGLWVVAANRFLSGLRSIVALLAGFNELPAWPTFSLAFISSLVWNGALLWVGNRLGKNWQQVEQYLREYNTVVILIIFALVLVWLGRRWHNRRINREDLPHES